MQKNKCTEYHLTDMISSDQHGSALIMTTTYSILPCAKQKNQQTTHNLIPATISVNIKNKKKQKKNQKKNKKTNNIKYQKSCASITYQVLNNVFAARCNPSSKSCFCNCTAN